MINIKKIIKFIEKEIFNQSNGPWVIMLFLIFGVPIILLIASIPALLFVLVLYFGSNFIYDFFPKKLTSEDFLSLEIGFISILITLKLAIITCFFLALIGTPLAYFLAFKSRKTKPLIETIVTLPLVLPPTVIGFYIIIFFNPETVTQAFFSVGSVSSG